ncbi:hypothetical protein MXD81_21690, partial [Microbacteriaceae bacterium K1510]|nr:hypothetical protein [Microbacteriaceae bacterium K1510]
MTASPDDADDAAGVDGATEAGGVTPCAWLSLGNCGSGTAPATGAALGVVCSVAAGGADEGAAVSCA